MVKISPPSCQLILEMDFAALYQELVVCQVRCWHLMHRLWPRGCASRRLMRWSVTRLSIYGALLNFKPGLLPALIVHDKILIISVLLLLRLLKVHLIVDHFRELNQARLHH